MASCPALKSEGAQTLRANVPEAELQRSEHAAIAVAANWANGPRYVGVLGDFGR